MSARTFIDILLVEDNPGDARLTQEAFADARVPSRLNWVTDGVEALAYLRREGSHAMARRPDLVLLDLKLPRKDGREFLAELRADGALKSLPVVVLTTSSAEEDILKVSQLQANAFLTKPLDLDDFVNLAQCINRFWQTIARPSVDRHPRQFDRQNR